MDLVTVMNQLKPARPLHACFLAIKLSLIVLANDRIWLIRIQDKTEFYNKYVSERYFHFSKETHTIFFIVITYTYLQSTAYQKSLVALHLYCNILYSILTCFAFMLAC